MTLSPTERVATRVMRKQQAREVPGVAIAAASGGHVEVQIGSQVWTCTDHPKRVAAAGDLLIIRETGNSRRVVQNKTRDANPPTTTASPSNAGSSSVSPGVNGTGSSGCYDWTDGSQLGTYARDIAAVTRSLAGDINELRGDVGDHASDISSLKGTVNSLVATVNNLKTAVESLRSALVAQGVIAS